MCPCIFKKACHIQYLVPPSEMLGVLFSAPRLPQQLEISFGLANSVDDMFASHMRAVCRAMAGL